MTYHEHPERIARAAGTVDEAKRFAIDAHVIGGKAQGSQTVLVNLLRAIADLGHADKFTLLSHDPAACRSRLSRDGFHHEALPRSGATRRLLLDLPKALARVGADVALFQYISPPLFRGRAIVVIHDILPITRPDLFPPLFALRSRLLFARSMAAARIIVTVSETTAEQIRKRYPRLAGKVRVVLNGPSFAPEVYTAWRSTSRPVGIAAPYVLTVGRIEKRKNIDMLARAFASANPAGVKLVIVGKRDLGFRAALPEQANIVMLDDVGDEALIDLYRHASLFVYPSMAEGFGIPLLDALLFGLPTISSNQTSMPEIAGDLATLFDPTRPDAESTLARLIGGHFAGRPIPAPSPDARAAHAAKFSWQQSAEALLAILDESSEGRHRP